MNKFSILPLLRNHCARIIFLFSNKLKARNLRISLQSTVVCQDLNVYSVACKKTLDKLNLFFFMRRQRDKETKFKLRLYLSFQSLLWRSTIILRLVPNSSPSVRLTVWKTSRKHNYIMTILTERLMFVMEKKKNSKKSLTSPAFSRYHSVHWNFNSYD